MLKLMVFPSLTYKRANSIHSAFANVLERAKAKPTAAHTAIQGKVVQEQAATSEIHASLSLAKEADAVEGRNRFHVKATINKTANLSWGQIPL